MTVRALVPMSGGFFNRFSPWGGGAAGVGINSRGATKARAGVATTQSAVLMDLGAPVAESPSRTMATTTLPTTAGNMDGGAICTVTDSVIWNTRHAALPFLPQKGISMMEVEGEGNLCPLLPPRGRDSKEWDSPPLPIRKDLMACIKTTEVKGEGNLLRPPLPPCDRDS